MNRRTLRRLELPDMDGAARVLRTSFDQALPWLAGLHTPDEDRWFFRERAFKTCAVWGAFDSAATIGILAFREGWIDQLYVLPEAQGRGVAPSCCTSRKAPSNACIFGLFSAMCRRAGFTKQEALR
jgi:hypothetical protein